MGKILVLLLLTIPLLSSPKHRIKTICGEYIYYTPTNVSVDEAKQIATKRAKISALANEFGTVLNQTNTTLIENINGQSQIDFTSLSASEVKGEWLEDIDTPQTQISYDQGMLVVKANVCGKARGITRAAIDFSAKILCNGKEDKFESENYRNGDDFYLSFQSPVSGYLAVYLIDDEQTAFCLLPYSNDIDGQIEVESGNQYLFFDAKSVPEKEKNKVDELILTCSKSIENNVIYIIFSPNSFTKANDNRQDIALPRKLPVDDFQKWLTKNRNMDNEMQVDMKTITISKQ